MRAKLNTHVPRIVATLVILVFVAGGGCRRSEIHSSTATIARTDLASHGLEDPFRLGPAHLDADAVNGILAAAEELRADGGRWLFDGAAVSSDQKKIYIFFHNRRAKDDNVIFVFDRTTKLNVFQMYWPGA